MHTATKRTLFLTSGLGLVVAAWAMAGPLNPPAGPISPTGATLAEIKGSVDAIEDAVVAPLLAPTVGYEVAGIAPGSMTTSLQTLVTGRGVIKRVVVDTELWTTAIAAELWVDGKFAGSFRGVASTTSVDHPPPYDVNIKFNSIVQAKVRVLNSSDRHSLAVHYLPTP